jgi:hypothetical protein
MYPWTLLIHSWLRWVVILLGAAVVIRAIAGAIGRRPWGPTDDRIVFAFMRSLDIQILIGLVLYFLLSPITRWALGHFGEAMGISGTRYFAVEHVFGIVVGLVLAHRGQSRIKSVSDPVAKQRVAAVFFVLALLAILVSIPWPGTPNARPLFRW